jgi:hypothetical protein
MGGPGLDLETREVILIAPSVTTGQAMPQLRAHTEAVPRLGV